MERWAAWLQYVTLAIAVVGAVLGVLNTWRTFSNDRVRVRVKPTFVMFNTGHETLAIDVVNLSTFPVTITSIGFSLLGTTEHMQLIAPRLSTGDALPKRLEPRTGFTAFAAAGATEGGRFDRVDAPYVKTACGLQIRGSAGALSVALHNLSVARRR